MVAATRSSPLKEAVLRDLDRGLRLKVMSRWALLRGDSARPERPEDVDLSAVDITSECLESDDSGSDSSPSESDEPAYRIRNRLPPRGKESEFQRPKYKARVDR